MVICCSFQHASSQLTAPCIITFFQLGFWVPLQTRLRTFGSNSILLHTLDYYQVLNDHIFTYPIQYDVLLM